MEGNLVRILSFIFSRFTLPGIYRIASLIYPYSSAFLQKGVWIEKRYLRPALNLRIRLFSKDLIDHKILFSGVYERETNWILEMHVRSGDVVVEAGANSGTETLLISRLVGRQGQVHAFEPVDIVLSKLKANLTLNGINNVNVHAVALGEESKMISFFVLQESHPNQGMGSKTISHANGTEIAVQQVSLDSLSLGRIDFLKMDVQGAELDILKGGRDCIMRYKPKIFLEAGDGWSNIRDIFIYLDNLGYNAFYISNDLRLIPITAENVRAGNWLAIPKREHETDHSKS